jgi:hypothetical protein
MKKKCHRTEILIFFAALFLLPACSKHGTLAEKGVLSPGSVSNPEKINRIMDHTTEYAEVDVMDAAATVLRSKRALGSESAERCWSLEANRPSLREACLLAWAAGEEKSELLEKAAAEGAASSHTLAVAALLRQTPLSQCSQDQFLGLLQIMKNDPLWMRARAVRIWLTNHSPPDPRYFRSLEELLGANGAPSPLSVDEAYRAAMAIGDARAAAYVSSYCVEGTAGIGRLRCWRFLGALVRKGPHDTLSPALLSYLPKAADQDWLLFKRTFPESALNLERFRN